MEPMRGCDGRSTAPRACSASRVAGVDLQDHLADRDRLEKEAILRIRNRNGSIGPTASFIRPDRFSMSPILRCAPILVRLLGDDRSIDLDRLTQAPLGVGLEARSFLCRRVSVIAFLRAYGRAAGSDRSENRGHRPRLRGRRRFHRATPETILTTSSPAPLRREFGRQSRDGIQRRVQIALNDLRQSTRSRKPPEVATLFDRRLRRPRSLRRTRQSFEGPHESREITSRAGKSEDDPRSRPSRPPSDRAHRCAQARCVTYAGRVRSASAGHCRARRA